MNSDGLSLARRQVCIWMPRELFNNGQYEERAEGDELVRRVTRSYSTPASGSHPRGTMSRFYEYTDADGVVVAKAFHHDRPIDPWRPDPKWLLVEGEILVPLHSDVETCADCATYRNRGPDPNPT